MIPRYTRPEMAKIWAPETRFRIWFEIEAHAASAMAELGLIPKSAAKAIWDKGSQAKFDIARIDAIEREVKHDVIAFLTHLAEHVGPEARFVHAGLTSSDILDTCFSVQLVRAADLLLADLDGLLAALKRRAREHKLTPTVGRSHGIHAEPTTFGLKLAQAYAEFARARERLLRARAEVATCALSGAVGTFANVDPRVEAYVAGKLGLTPEPISTQVIPRDRHAMYFATLAVIASSLERLAIEVRHLQRTEVLEAEEYFSAGTEGLLLHAAQAQSRGLGEHHRARPHGAQLLPARHGGRGALARARHLALLRRAHDRARRHGDARLHPAAHDGPDRQARRLSGEHGEEPRPAGRARPLSARAHRPDPEGRRARGRLRHRAAPRHGRVAGPEHGRPRLPGAPEGRSRGDEGPASPPSSRPCSTSSTTSSTSTPSSPACSDGRSGRYVIPAAADAARE